MGIDSDARLSAVRFHGVGHRARAAGAVASEQLVLYRNSGQGAKSLIRKGMIPIKRRGLIGGAAWAPGLVLALLVGYWHGIWMPAQIATTPARGSILARVSQQLPPTRMVPPWG